ncbi:MAG: hypothetical protein JNL34_12765 [Anaerolineae bacterium]|nr:hypothetical protein [Anaerolineae bacterium]
MGRMIVLLLATMMVWGSVAWILTSTPTPDNFVYLILGAAAFLSTGIIWGVGGSVDTGRKREAPQRQDYANRDTKAKRETNSLASVVDGLTPEQVASLELALQRRRDSYDEDEQILANRLSAEYDRTSQQQP